MSESDPAAAVAPSNLPTESIKRLLPWLVAVAFFMQSLDTTILNTAVPAIAKALAVTPLSMKAVLASYTLSLAVFGLSANAVMLYSLQDSTQLRKFIDDSEAPDVQKRIEHRKLNALLGLCEAASCRRRILLEYFGDTCGSCGNCDNCLFPPETFDGTIAAQKALSCCYRTGQRFGTHYLIEMLLGNADERMQQFGHDQLSTFGIGREHEKSEWQSIFRQLVAANLLTVDTSEFGSVKITPRGNVFLKQRETLRLRKWERPAKTKERRSSRAAVVFDEEGDGDPFQALRAKRMELAREQNVAPFVIFHDRVLREMAVKKPTSWKEFGQINGVGQAKLERYWDEFTQVVLTHMRQD